MNANTCNNHTEYIARDLHSLHHSSLAPEIDADWDALSNEQQQAWLKVAGNILPVLGRHALGDLLTYAQRKLEETSSIGKKILWSLFAAVSLAAASWISLACLTGCAHTINASREDGIIICRDGVCLTIKDGRVTYGYRPYANVPAPINKSRK